MNYKTMIDQEAKAVCFECLLEFDISDGIAFSDSSFIHHCSDVYDYDEILASENAVEPVSSFANTEESGYLRDWVQVRDTISADMQERINFHIEQYKNSLNRKLLQRAYEHLKSMSKLRWPPVNQARNLLKEILCPK
jgi:hypothetical protein